MKTKFLGALVGGLMAFGTVAAIAADDLFWVPEELTEGLEEARSGFDDFYVKPGVDLSEYNQIYIDPVVFALENELLERELGNVDRSSLARQFERAFERALSEDVLADSPGEGVLVIEFALIDVAPNRDILGTAVRSTPRGRGQVNALSVGIGGAKMEAVFMDGATGDVVAVAADDWQGRPININNNIVTRWGDARDAFRSWARELRRLVD